MLRYLIPTAIILATFIHQGASLWCFECVSTQPGCGTPFNWIFLWSNVCKEDNDVCVKITERKGVETIITRSCLSLIKSVRHDIPADTYEGCRAAAVNENLGNYVNNSIKELDIHRRYFDETEYCFCFLDHRCNTGAKDGPKIALALLTTFLVLFYY